MFKDYYSILEISPESSRTEIIQAFKKQAKKWHPDINGSQDATKKMQDIIEAYHILSNNEKKQRYDSEYSRYYSFKSAQQDKFDDKSYSFEDSDLKDWMNEAASESRQNFKKVFNDLNDVINAGMMGSWELIKKTLKIFAILFLGLIILVAIFNLAENESNVSIYSEFKPIGVLPEFEANDSFTYHRIPCFGSFSLPTTLERKNESVDGLDYLESPNYIGSNPGSDIIYKATFQQKGLNMKEPEALSKYVRVLLRSELISNSSFPFLLDGSKITNVDLYRYSSTFYKYLEELLVPLGGQILQKGRFEEVEINNLSGLTAVYTRKQNDNPDVRVEVYYFRKDDILYTITTSHRESESGIWQIDLKKFLNSIEIENPLKMPCREMVKNRTSNEKEFIKIDTLKNLIGFSHTENFTHYTIKEFGQISLPGKLTHRKQFSQGPELFIDLFVDNSIEGSANQAYPLYAKVQVITQKGKPGLTSVNSQSLKISDSELRKLSNETRIQYQGHGREIFNWSDCKAVSVNNFLAVKFKYFSMVNNYPPVMCEEYYFDNYDRRHVLSFSFPVQDTTLWQKEFVKVLSSVILFEKSISIN